jgi:hypothetical protein
MSTQRYSVEVHWDGAGLVRTMPFISAEAAQAWGDAKAADRPNPVVRVAPRPPRRDPRDEYDTGLDKCGPQWGDEEDEGESE